MTFACASATLWAGLTSGFCLFMRVFYRLFPLACLLVLLCGIGGRDAWADMRRLAYSKEKGLEVYASSATGSWCREALYLQMVTETPSFYGSEDFHFLMRKIGKIIDLECPAALAATIDGFDRENRFVFQATASEEKKWMVDEKDIQDFQSQTEAGLSQDGETIYRSFKVRHWMPPHLGDPIREYGDTLPDRTVFTEDGDCGMRYLRRLSADQMEGYYLDVGDARCHGGLLNGKARVQVLDRDGQADGAGIGHFTEGYFTGSERWDVPLMARYEISPDEQRLNYLIEADADLRIYYIGYLESRFIPETGRFTAFHGCRPFRVAAVTENKSLFINDAAVSHLVTKAGSYAASFCPDIDEFLFFGVQAPRGVSGVDHAPDTSDPEAWQKDENFMFATRVTRHPDTGVWQFSPSDTINRVRFLSQQSLESKRRKWGELAADYARLKKEDDLARLAYLHGVDRIDHPLRKGVESRLLDAPVSGHFLLRLKGAIQGEGLADWPTTMRLKQVPPSLAEGGYAIVSGNLTVHKHLLGTVAEPLLTIKNMTPCLEPYCRDAADVLSLVRRRHKVPDWSPDAPPRLTEDKP